MTTLSKTQLTQLEKAVQKFKEQGVIINSQLLVNEYAYQFTFSTNKDTDLKNVTPMFYKILKRGFQIFTDPSDENIEVYLYQ